MNIKNNLKTGFTIVEISLFLGLSGLLAAGLMVGWSVNINRQRYNDTVNTFKSTIQQAFSDVENAENARSKNYNCSVSNNNVVLKQDNSGSSRGQSNCVVLGKYITFGSGHLDSNTNRPAYDNVYSVRDVIGLDIDASTACKVGAASSPCANDVDALRATKFVVAEGANYIENTKKSYTLEWDGAYKAVTELSKFGTIDTGSLPSTSTIYGILVLRSPIDGSTRVFGVPVYSNNGSVNSIYLNDEGRQSLRDNIMSEVTLLKDARKVEICISPRYVSSSGVGEVSVFGRNKAILIGNTSASVEVAPMDGAGSVTCNGENGLTGVNRG